MITTNDVRDYFNVLGTIIINDDVVNVTGNVHLIEQVKQLPFQFGNVTGDFKCYNNELTTLEGSPKSVGGSFWCYNNELTSLVGSPLSVKGSFRCYENKLKTLDGAPKTVEDLFHVDWQEDLPMLSLLKYGKIMLIIDGNDQVSRIINQHNGTKPLRKAILDCQKDLLDAGYKGNARL